MGFGQGVRAGGRMTCLIGVCGESGTTSPPWAFGGSMATDTPGIRRVELYASDATLNFTPNEVAKVVRSYLPV